MKSHLLKTSALLLGVLISSGCQLAYKLHLGLWDIVPSQNSAKRVNQGRVTTLVGAAAGADGHLNHARFMTPYGMTHDSAGNLIVTEQGSSIIRKISSSGDVTTVAGLYGTPGLINGTATNARFYSPTGAAVDSHGNLFIADRDNCEIRKITPDGTVSLFAGSAIGTIGHADGIGPAATFYMPYGLVVDSQDTLFVVDSYNMTIRKILPDGTVSVFAGSTGLTGSADGNGTAARFYVPMSIAIDSSDNLYIGDSYNFSIRKITPAGDVTTLAGGSAGSADGMGNLAQFGLIGGLTIASDGNLYVTDSSSFTIRKVTLAGMVSTIAGTSGSSGFADGAGTSATFNTPQGITSDSNGNLYVADNTNYLIRKIDPSYNVSTYSGGISGGVGTGKDAILKFPIELALDPSGNIYTSELQAYVIRKITGSGETSVFAGHYGVPGWADGTGTAATLYATYALTGDPFGNVWMKDNGTGVLRKITPAGVVTSVAGALFSSGSTDGTGTGATLGVCYGMASDLNGNIYLTDANYNIIRKVTPSGVVTTLAGTAGVTGSADGVGAAAEFNLPTGITVTPDGNIFVFDFGSYLIRKITPDGTVSTFAGQPGVTGGVDGIGMSATFGGSYQIASDADGNIYVPDISVSGIRKITPEAVVTTIAGNGTSGDKDGTGRDAGFMIPTGIAINGDGEIYVSEMMSGTIRMIR